MVKVKICGITNPDDAHAAVLCGADAIGFVFYRGSPRHVTPEQARDIIVGLPPFITTVGVFVDEKPAEIERIILYAGIQVVQLHGNESPDACSISRKVIKAIRVRELKDLAPLRDYCVSAFLLDTFTTESLGGTGQMFNWDIAVEAKQFGKVILAGGLTPENVKKAVQWVKPFGVDVSSGVEADKGVKDHRKLKVFIERAKGIL